MSGPFGGASASLLRSLADGFRSGRVGGSVSRLTLNRICPCPDGLADEVIQLVGDGMAPTHLALLLEACADAVEGRTSSLPIELVWTGPEGPGSQSRDTGVVARELFSLAERSVLVSTFVLRQAASILEPLATRMDERPELGVRLFLHVDRDWRDTRHESEILREFADSLRNEWPGTRHPEVYYDPRSLATDEGKRATWHAKCVLVDDEISFVTSANFTEWGQQRNVEAGVLVHDRHFTNKLRAQFDSLVQARQVRRLPGF